MVHYKKLLAAALTIGCTATTIPIHNANAATMKIGYNGQNPLLYWNSINI